MQTGQPRGAIIGTRAQRGVAVCTLAQGSALRTRQHVTMKRSRSETAEREVSGQFARCVVCGRPDATVLAGNRSRWCHWCARHQRVRNTDQRQTGMARNVSLVHRLSALVVRRWTRTRTTCTGKGGRAMRMMVMRMTVMTTTTTTAMTRCSSRSRLCSWCVCTQRQPNHAAVRGSEG